MSEKNTGGPAFPYFMDGESHEGMTLRDYFAARAIRPLTSSAKSYREAEAEGMAREAYMIADAMLKARGKA